ncbi:MAG: nuclear transport factor 2 family protein [Raineya sp.]|nr:nuclear transport factor 2 family protein [Raineya sp.]
MKKNVLLMLLFFPVTLFVYAQDKRLIQEALDNYFQGYIENDSVILKKSFELQHGHMKGVMKSQASQDSLWARNFDGVVRRWATKTPFTDVQKKKSYYKILSIDIVENKMAVAKIKIQLAERLFIDYLSLYKINGTWKIVNKIFVELPALNKN